VCVGENAGPHPFSQSEREKVASCALQRKREAGDRPRALAPALTHAPPALLSPAQGPSGWCCIAPRARRGPPSLSPAAGAQRCTHTLRSPPHTVPPGVRARARLAMASTTVYVGNVEATVDEFTLKSIFENCGAVVGVRLAG